MRKVRRKVTEEEVGLMIQLYLEGKNTVEIGKELDLTSRTVWQRLERAGVIERKKTEITPVLIKSIIDLYEEGTPSTEISKKLNISKSTVLKYLKENNVEIKDKTFYNTYEANLEFFDNIDTANKAYWLGVMFADGYNDQHNCAITLCNAEKDKQLPYGLKEALESTHLIYERNREGNAQDVYSLTIYSKHLSNSLANLGCVQNKTDRLTYPNIPQEFNKDFIRGYFDGDGSVWVHNNRKFISITGYLPFMQEIQNVLIQETNLNKTKLAVRKGKYGDIRYGGIEPPKIFAEYIYYEGCTKLDRKYNLLMS